MAWPSGKAEACKASIPQFESGCHLSFSRQSRMLYLVATPIGNLGDFTYRAIETLKNCDYILCEDTLHSQRLLHHYQIHKPLKSFHKFNEASQQEKVLSDLKNGIVIALISDAGTPGISDPGNQLVQACLKNEINVVAIPGPCAAIAALSCSGMNTDRFQFIGFLPKKAEALRRMLQEILAYTGTTVCYESPNRIANTLQKISEIAPERQVMLARELTKKFEEAIHGKAQEIAHLCQEKQLKGELVLVIAGQESTLGEDWESLSVEEHVKWMEAAYHMPHLEAIKMVAKLRGVPKRLIYGETEKKKSKSF